METTSEESCALLFLIFIVTPVVMVLVSAVFGPIIGFGVGLGTLIAALPEKEKE